MAVDVRSAFLCSRLVIPNMKSKRWGCIINLGSQLAQKGAPDLAHYRRLEGRRDRLTRSLARELVGFGITVNAICPGPIDTDLSRTNSPEWKAELISQIPIGRYGEPEEIAPSRGASRVGRRLFLRRRSAASERRRLNGLIVCRFGG